MNVSSPTGRKGQCPVNGKVAHRPKVALSYFAAMRLGRIRASFVIIVFIRFIALSELL